MRWFLLLLVFLTVRVKADGGYVPRTGLAGAVEIPSQTAVLCHDGGKETLTVWNSLRSPGENLAWVLPLPAAPEIIQQTNSRPLSAMRLLTAPTVRLADVHPGYIVMAVPTLMVIGSLLFRRRHDQWHPAYGTGTAIGFVWLALLAMAISWRDNLMGTDAEAPALSGVEVLAQQMTGDYQTTVIRGITPEAVDTWLQQAGFPKLSGDQLEAAREYLAKGWVFLCAKLESTPAGALEAHPLTVRFATDRPVYPMRFTRSAGTVPVEVYLFSRQPLTDATGRLKDLAAWDSYPPADKSESRGGAGHHNMELIHSLTEQYVADTAASPAGKPKDLLLEALSSVPFAGRFQGVFQPDSDWSDVAFTTAAEPPPAISHATRGGLFTRALTQLMLYSALPLVALALFARIRAAPGESPAKGYRLATLAIVALLPVLSAAYAFSDHVLAGGRVRLVEASQEPVRKLRRTDSRTLLYEWFESLRPQPLRD